MEGVANIEARRVKKIHKITLQQTKKVSLLLFWGRDNDFPENV